MGIFLKKLLNSRRVILWRLLFLIVVGLTAVGCTPPFAASGESDDLQGKILVWYSWSGPRATVLQELLQSFSAVHPEVTIISEYVPPSDLRPRFLDQTIAGLGPDVLVGVSLFQIDNLQAAGALTDLAEYELDTNNLLPQAVNALYLDEALYGIPISASTSVLYYNKEMIEEPAETLDQLLADAQEGQLIAFPSSFYHGFWGIRAFGGNLFDESGQVVVDEGLIAWLVWLRDAQNIPTIVLSSNYQDLLTTFQNGQAAYFIGSTIDLPRLQEALGESLGVALLPRAGAAPDDSENPTEAGDDLPDPISAADEAAQPTATPLPEQAQQPGAFLELEVTAISKVSAEKEVSLALINFLTSRSNQRTFALSNFGQIPVNIRVSFDPRLAPIATTLIEQSHYAPVIPLRTLRLESQLLTVGDDVYLAVLSGLITPRQGAIQLSEQMNANLVIPPEE